MSDPPEEVWRFDNGGADGENRRNELNYDLSADGFCPPSFFGVAALFRLLCVLFNFLAQFKQGIRLDHAPRFSTVRDTTLKVGSILGSGGRPAVLRLVLRRSLARPLGEPPRPHRAAVNCNAALPS